MLMTTLTLALALAPATLDAQQQQPAPRRVHARPEFAANAAARVLALPTVLELTRQQIAQLEQIRDRANAQNQPLLAQLEAVRPQHPAREPGVERAQPEQRRAELRAKREQLQPVRAQLRENAAKTRREVEGVLTSEQLAKLHELENAWHPGGERGPRPAR
jgi:Spy/CpxP family protein refolding chaperone